jgi:6-phosphofructo-2-kinase/fructose-2,6-biphosphatase 2
MERVAKEKGFKLIFLESVCNDPKVIDANIAVKVSSGDPDYDGMPREKAEADFRNRIALYERNYETIDPDVDHNMCYAKIINVGSQVIVNRIDGYLQSRIVFYLMNLHLTPRSIYITRVRCLLVQANMTYQLQHGESQYNLEGKIGGDALLSSRGEKYMEALPQLISEKVGDAPLTVWTSTLRRTIQTASKLPYPKLTWKSLDELDAGVCDGMTYEEIAVRGIGQP